jgi:hypothetical protein
LSTPKSGFFSLMEKVEKGAGGSPKANKAGVHFNFSPEKGDERTRSVFKLLWSEPALRF